MLRLLHVLLLLLLLLLLPLEETSADVVDLCWCEAHVAGGLAEGSLPVPEAPFLVPHDAGADTLVLGTPIV